MLRQPRTNLSELILQIQNDAEPPLSRWNLLCLSTVTALVSFLGVFLLVRLCLRFHRRRQVAGRAPLKSETTSSFLLDTAAMRYDAV
uniref:Transmembrane protein n=1 Tax=Steinernema glaseri TaxID=37863 RepID=A0A1I7YF83_9BILA